MDALDIIKQLCKNRGITITQLENDLSYSNGSINKAKSMSADRLYQISQYFNVSMEYLMTGKTINETDDEMSLLRQQQSILMEINKISQAMASYYKEIAKCQDKLSELKKDYNKVEAKRLKKDTDSTDSNTTPSGQFPMFLDSGTGFGAPYIDESTPFDINIGENLPFN